MKYLYWRCYANYDNIIDAAKELVKRTSEQNPTDEELNVVDEEDLFIMGVELFVESVVDVICHDRGIAPIKENLGYSYSRTNVNDYVIYARYCFASDDDALVFYMSAPAGQIFFNANDMLNG